MSSYLNIYLVLKEDENKKLNLFSFSRSNTIYQAFNDNISIPYLKDDFSSKYNEINIDDIDNILKSVKEDIEKADKRLREYEKYVSTQVEYIEEIISIKEYIDELKDTYSKIEMISYILDNMKYESTTFSKIVINID